MQMRKGREFYGSKYDEAMRLFKEGKDTNSIARQIGISYSCAYHWTRELRAPSAGNVNGFIEHIRQNGPLAAVHILQKFPKHNELFLIASRRGLDIRRAYLGKKFKELGTWYYLTGQEAQLDERVEETRKKIEELRARMISGKS